MPHPFVLGDPPQAIIDIIIAATIDIIGFNHAVLVVVGEIVVDAVVIVSFDIVNVSLFVHQLQLMLIAEIVIRGLDEKINTERSYHIGSNFRH